MKCSLRTAPTADELGLPRIASRNSMQPAGTKVEHPFHVIKHMFRHPTTRSRMPTIHAQGTSWR